MSNYKLTIVKQEMMYWLGKDEKIVWDSSLKLRFTEISENVVGGF